MRMHAARILLLWLLIACGDGSVPHETPPDTEWTHHSGNAAGHRYSPAAQITPSNVRRLAVAWTARMHGDDSTCAACTPLRTRVEVTPVLWDGTLYLSSPYGRILALDAATGARRWTFETRTNLDAPYLEGLTTRGVSLWVDSDSGLAPRCHVRVFAVTVDARLFALDAADGTLCSDFGTGGVICLRDGVGLSGAPVSTSQYSITSPPLALGDVVIVGAAIDGHLAREGVSGVVRAFDVRSGALRWTFDALPRSVEDPNANDWTAEAMRETGGGNVWSHLSGDAARDLVFLPTASASPNHFGGGRPGRNERANSVVALRASTGQLVWSFQLVHHDLWDYDVATQPLLITWGTGGDTVPALVVMNKTGSVFVLNRLTGEPLQPVEERPVPASTVPGETASLTQPFSRVTPLLHGAALTPDSAFGITDAERAFCRERLATSRLSGLFTPPSLEGTVVWPGMWGGPNWDGAAWDPVRRALVVPVRRLATVVQLVPRERVASLPALQPGEQRFRQTGTPYLVRRMPLVSPSGVPCTPPPWSALVSLHVDGGAVQWSRALGTIPALADRPNATRLGSLAFGGPLLTASGLAFIAASQDDHLRAFDLADGSLLWQYRLPAGGQAAPLSYVQGGRQFVVIVAGGRGGIGSVGDWVIAFTLPPL